MSLGLTEYSYSRVLVCEINSTQLCSAAVSAGDESKKIVERKDETTDLTTKLPETQGTEFELYSSNPITGRIKPILDTPPRF